MEGVGCDMNWDGGDKKDTRVDCFLAGLGFVYDVGLAPVPITLMEFSCLWALQ